MEFDCILPPQVWIPEAVKTSVPEPCRSFWGFRNTAHGNMINLKESKRMDEEPNRPPEPSRPVYDEKGEEKTHEKQQEKSWEEKQRRDPLSTLGWATLLIWAGLVLLGENIGLFGPTLRDLGAWNLILAGGGVISLGVALVRLLVPQYRGPVVGNIILGLVLLGVSLGEAFGWGLIWPIILIGFGLAILLRGLIR